MKHEVLKTVRDVIIDEDCMWIITSTLNCLFKYSFLRHALELTAVFPEIMRTDFEPFTKIVKKENEIYFIPRMANDIFYYNINDRSFHELCVPFNNFQTSKNIGVVTYGDKIYCVNRFPDAVIKIDTITKNTEIFNANINQSPNKDIESKIYRKYIDPCLFQNKIIWPNYNNILTIFDIENESFSLEILEGMPHERIERLRDIFEEKIEDFIVGIRAFEGKLWLCTHEGKICQYNDGLIKIEDKIVDSYAHYEDDFRSRIIYDIVPLKDELWFIPAYKNRCIKYNSNTKQFEEALDNYVENWEGYRRSYSLCKVINNRVILLYSYYENCFYILDTENDSVCKKTIELPYAKFASEDYNFEQMVFKDKIYSFDNLEFLFNKECQQNEKEQKKLTQNIGQQIFEALKR